MDGKATEAVEDGERARLWHVAAGYLAACAAAALMLALHLMIKSYVGEGLADAIGVLFAGLIGGFLLIGFLSLPSFLILRGFLHLARRTDLFSFAALGAVNAYGLVSVLFGADTFELFLRYPPDSIIAVAGAAGGAASLLTERHLANRAKLIGGSS
jgi:hypothetical protein